MARILVSFDELAAAIGGLQPVDIDGVRHFDGEALVRAVEALVPSVRLLSDDHVARQVGVSLPSAPEHAFAFSSGSSAFEAERQRLAAIPPGPCVGCRHVAHEGGRCVDCDCNDYVDPVVRDPIEAARDRGDVEMLQRLAGTEGGAPDGTILPAISRYDSATIGLDLGRAPSRWVGGDNINPNAPMPTFTQGLQEET